MMFRSRIIAITTAVVCVCAARMDAQAPIRPVPDAIDAIKAIGGRFYLTSDGLVDIVDLKVATVADEQLALLQSIPTVRILNLGGSRITDGGIEQLLKLPNLEEVSLLGTPVSPAAATALKDRHPKIYAVKTSPTGLRFERLIAAIIVIPMGLMGVWLVRLARRKRSVLTPRLYARGMLWGILLVVAALVLLAVAVVQSLGFDFHLSNLFG